MEGPKKRSGEKRPKVIRISEAEKMLKAVGFKRQEFRKGKHEMFIHETTGERFPLTRGSGQSLSVYVTKQVFEVTDKYPKK